MVFENIEFTEPCSEQIVIKGSFHLNQKNLIIKTLHGILFYTTRGSLSRNKDYLWIIQSNRVSESVLGKVIVKLI